MPSTPTASVDGRPIAKTLAENVKETLESIVVAFILAFVFRAFIVEAFVIPTGSMAVTLYGNQLTKTCSACGYEYALGITESMRPSTVPLHCPNCDVLCDKFTPEEVARPDSGDRILVHKWPLNIGGEYLGPHRWDVTVFKDPRDGSTNFIKRLVGLPGEALEIIDGDVYSVKLDKLKPDLIDKMNKLRLDVYALRLPERQDEVRVPGRREELKQQFLKRYGEINEQILPLLRIQRKLSHQTIAQQSLWFNVYNNDYFPNYPSGSQTAGGTHVRWQPVDDAAGKAWSTNAREFKFQSDAPSPLEIQFAGKDIDDFYAYNIEGFDRSQHARQGVGDVRLRFVWFPESGKGGLRLRMNRDDDEFTASIGLDGSTRIEGDQPEIEASGHHQVIGEKKLAAFTPGRAVSIEFINLDYRVSLLVDGEEVIASNDDQYGPRLPKLKRLIAEALRQPDGYVEVKPTSIRIAAQQMSCRLRHIVLERDVYYRSQEQQEPPEIRDENGAFVAYNPYYLWPGWATSGMPMMLRTAHRVNGKLFGAEYLMLGDNSPASKDSRLWWEIGPHLKRLGSDYQVATVPEDQLIGKAFFVYWPAGYRPSWSPGIGIIPNFGRMRWIR